MSDSESRVLGVPSTTKNLFPVREDTILKAFLRKGPEQSEFTNQGMSYGRVDHPFDMTEVLNFKNHNVHHSRCIDTKVMSLVGLGFESDADKQRKDDPLQEIPGGTPSAEKRRSKVSEILDPLCKVSFQDVIERVAADYEQVGNGYIEVVRDVATSEIVGLYHLPAQTVYIYVEETRRFFFEIRSGEYSTIAGASNFDMVFANFNDRDRVAALTNTDPRLVSEVIHFPKASPLSRWYGGPDWLSATSSVELVQMMTQHHYDFFQNRGVPEFMLFATGASVPKKDWEAIQDAIKAGIGRGKAYKSICANFPQPDLKVQIERLAQEGSGEMPFTAFSDTLALQIVSAHGVPPLLAGIQTPGKIGATNELPNALMAFQVLTIGPAQRHFQTILGNTLAGEGGVPGLTLDDFTFNKITDEIDTGKMDTVSRMRQTVPEATAEGRKPEDGLKD